MYWSSHLSVLSDGPNTSLGLTPRSVATQIFFFGDPWSLKDPLSLVKSLKISKIWLTETKRARDIFRMGANSKTIILWDTMAQLLSKTVYFKFWNSQYLRAKIVCAELERVFIWGSSKSSRRRSHKVSSKYPELLLVNQLWICWFSTADLGGFYPGESFLSAPASKGNSMRFA